MLVSGNGGMVKVYDKTGNHLKTYQHDAAEKQLFSQSTMIAWSDDNNTIFVTDGGKGLIAMDTSGTLQWVFTDHDLKSPSGL